MTDISFSKEEKAVLVRRIQLYFDQELSQTIGSFDAEFLLDFFSKEVGAYFYNRGLYDAQTVLSGQLDEMSDTILQLEKPTEFQR